MRCVACGVWRVVRGAWCVVYVACGMCGAWCVRVVCGVRCVWRVVRVCRVWYVWCVVCDVTWLARLGSARLGSARHGSMRLARPVHFYRFYDFFKCSFKKKAPRRRRGAIFCFSQ